MIRMRFLLTPLVTCGVMVVSAAAQQTVRPSFEVASIRKHDPSVSITPTGPGPNGPNAPRTLLTRRSQTLAALVRYAYFVPDFLIKGGPPWIREDQFDVHRQGG